MPELPEVESVVQDIRPFVVGKRISSLQVEVPRLIKTDENEFLSVLPGKRIERVERRGKYILIFLEILMTKLDLPIEALNSITSKSMTKTVIRSI